MTALAARAAGHWHPLLYLTVREIRTRHTGDRLGYAWAYVTPLAWIAVIYASYSYIGRTPSIDTDLLSFIIAGMLPYTAFRYSIAAMIRARTGTLQFRLMTGTPLEPVCLAVALVEYYNALLIYAVLFGFNWIVFGKAELADPLFALLGFTLAWGIGAAVGYLVVMLSVRSPGVPRLVPTLLRPVFFLSGIFYTANELPTSIAEVLQYNPLLDAIEIVRTGIFQNYTARYLDIATPLAFIAACLIAGRLVSRRGGAEAEAEAVAP